MPALAKLSATAGIGGCVCSPSEAAALRAQHPEPFVLVTQVYPGGMQFRTPEAITAVNTFRACHYLRAMAIWGLWATITDWEVIPGAKRG